MDLQLIGGVNSTSNLSLQKPRSSKAPSSNPPNWTPVSETQTQLGSVWSAKSESITHPQVWVARLNVTETLQTRLSACPLLMQTSIWPTPRHYKHSLWLLYCTEGREQQLKKRSKGAQKNAKSSHIKDRVTNEHFWISQLFYPGLFQWKTGSWHCWWKPRSGAHIFNHVIIDSSKTGMADMSGRMHSADFMSNTPSNHYPQLISTNHKLLTTRNKTRQRSNSSCKSVSLILRITVYFNTSLQRMLLSKSI